MKRIRGVNPTLNQAKIMQKNNMDSSQWLVSKVFSDHLECIHKMTGERKRAYFEVMRV